MSTSLLDLPGLRARESAEPGFARALSDIADALNLDPNYIGAVMANESGFNPQAQNPHGGATGLIQFMPATAVLLGTTTAELHAMTAIEQLPFVQAFYEKTGKAIRKDVPGDYYMATFLPAFVGKDPSFVLAVPGEPIYDQNAGLDTNHDGVLTVGDVTQRIDNTVAAARAKPLAVFPDAPPPQKKNLASTPTHPEEPRPLQPSPSPASPSGSSGPLSASAGAGSSPDNLRNLVVFAGSCELEDMALMVAKDDVAGVAARIDAYWANVLHQNPEAPHPKEWCGALALFCLHSAGLGLSLSWLFGPPHFGFLWNLEQTKSPKPGDIAYLDKPWQHHAIVVEVVGGVVHTIDGNQGPTEPIKTHEAPLTHWTAFFSIESLIAEASR